MQIKLGYKIVIFFLLSRECQTWPVILRGGTKVEGERENVAEQDICT